MTSKKANKSKCGDSGEAAMGMTLANHADITPSAAPSMYELSPRATLAAPAHTQQ